MKYIKLTIASLLFAFMIAGPAVVVTTPTPVSAACQDRVMLFPTWYRGLTDANCEPVFPTGPGNIQTFVTILAINIIEIMMIAVGYIALFFILYGGFQFITGGYNPGSVEKGRHTILNAVIGLAISLGAVAILNLIFSIVGDGGAATINAGVATGEVTIPGLTGEQLLLNILNTTYFLAGVVAVVVIIVAGLTYTMSGGDSSKLTRAKNQILFSVIGLVVVLTASVFTNFIIGRF